VQIVGLITYVSHLSISARRCGCRVTQWADDCRLLSVSSLSLNLVGGLHSVLSERQLWLSYWSAYFCNTDSWKPDFELQFLHIHVRRDLLSDTLRLAFGKRRKSDSQTAADKQIQFGDSVIQMCSYSFVMPSACYTWKRLRYTKVWLTCFFLFSNAEHRVMRGIFESQGHKVTSIYKTAYCGA